MRRLPTALVPGLVDEVAPGLLAATTEDPVALLGLHDRAQAAAVAEHLASREAAGIDHVLCGPDLATLFGDPVSDRGALPFIAWDVR